MNHDFLSLKPLLQNEDFTDVMVGSSRFTDDTWDMSTHIESKTLDNTHRKIKFSYIKTSWNSQRLKNFVKRWDIRDKDGSLYPLKSHQFRATFVRELIKQNVSINHVMKQFGHVSLAMTMHYLTLQEHEIREIYTEMVLRPESKIAGIRAAEIKDKLEPHFKGKTEPEIETFISELAETMSFNPLPNGMCLYDFRR